MRLAARFAADAAAHIIGIGYTARLGVPKADIEAFLDDLAANAMQVRIPFRLRPFLHDPDDDFIAELAVAASADVIVTFNARNFRMARLLGIRVETPAEFLDSGPLHERHR